MLHVSRSSAIAILIAIVGVVAGRAQNNSNSVTGFVFGEDRMPVSRIYVELQNDMYSTVSRTQTSGSGMYTFRGIPQGQYYVRVLALGTNYEEQSQRVSLYPLSPVGRGSVSEQVDFYLRARRTSNPLAPPEAVFVQEVPLKAKDLYEAGINELEKKNEQAGFDKLKAALEIFPDYFAALDRLGNEYLNRGYYEASYVLLKRAISVNPRSISSTLGLGLTEYRLNKVPESIDQFEEVLKLHKENMTAHYWLGIALHSTGKLDQALSSLQKAEKLSEGKSPEVQWQLARLYKDQNKFKESADALETYLKLKPHAENAEEVRRIIKVLRAKK